MSLRQDVLRAFAELQLRAIDPTPAPLLDDPAAVATDVVTYLNGAPHLVAEGFGLALDQIDWKAHADFGLPFAQLDLPKRRSVLDRIAQDPLGQTLLAMLGRASWLIIYSREPARRRVGFSRPPDLPPPTDVPAPDVASLRHTYDVCVVGSGAGGSVVAARLASAGRDVLLVDEGSWVNPKSYSARDDRALTQLYRDSGIQPALPALDYIPRRHGFGFMTVLQARVFGGGPVVNNAIHLPIARDRWSQWRSDNAFPVDWPDLEVALSRVGSDLGVSPSEMKRAQGERSTTFETGAGRLGLPVEDLPLSVLDCLGCGGCNVGCQFGRKTGGPHGHRPAGQPSSYLQRAIEAHCSIRPGLRAINLIADFLSRRAVALKCLDLTDGKREVHVKARQFVIAAGPIASSRILRDSLFQVLSPIGHHMAANVVSPVFAELPQDIEPARNNPGIQMCVFVDQGGRLLESWFHYPGSLAAALPQWLEEHAGVMKAYKRLAVCAVVVPTANNGELGPTNNLVLSLSEEELTQMKEGMVQVAEAFFAAGATRVLPGTSFPLQINAATKDVDEATLRRSVTGQADLTLSTAHLQGGNALGQDALHSVVSPGFNLYDFDNVFVADSSLFPAGCERNPQMTTMALAHLAADRILAA
jgi:choline dehydrogenase-like flavoprotein